MIILILYDFSCSSHKSYKSQFPIDVTPLGMVIEVNPELLKPALPMLFTFLPIVTEVIQEVVKVLLAISMTLLPMTAEARPVPTFHT